MATPSKPQEMYDLVEQAEQDCGAQAKIAIAKLLHAAVQLSTSNEILQSELQTTRQATLDAEKLRRSKRVEKEQNQRVWNMEQVLHSRKPKVGRIVERKMRGHKKLILALPGRLPD